MTQKEKLLIWIFYNHRNFEIKQAGALSMQFSKAVSGAWKYCRCTDRGHAVNSMWEDWHCTYCLKPKKEMAGGTTLDKA